MITEISKNPSASQMRMKDEAGLSDGSVAAAQQNGLRCPSPDKDPHVVMP